MRGRGGGFVRGREIREGEGETLGGGRVVRGDCEVKCQENLGDVFVFNPDLTQL